MVTRIVYVILLPSGQYIGKDGLVEDVSEAVEYASDTAAGASLRKLTECEGATVRKFLKSVYYCAVTE